MKNRIKISVILPVYNEERYLRKCLDSLCAQTLKEIEIICVDDGSTDHSLNILKEYGKQDDRITILTQKNLYAGAARNYGMSHANGTYLLFLDSDDFFREDMLEKLYLKAEGNRLDITICRYELYHDIGRKRMTVHNRKKEEYYPRGREVFSGKDMLHAGIFQGTGGWAWDKLFRGEFIKQCGYQFPEFRSSEDGFFVYMLAARADKIGFVPETLVSHRVFNPGSLSNTMEQNWENGFKMLRLIREELRKLGIYAVYEQSFISFAVEFQIYYLKSMYERKAFCHCYRYIKEVMEPEFKLADFPGQYLCSKKDAEQYRQVLNMDGEDFLFIMLREKQDRLITDREKGWVFPYDLIPKGSRLILYGAGAVGQEYYAQLMQTGYCRSVKLVDRNYREYKGREMQAENPQILKNRDFDYVLIAIRNREIQKSVKGWIQSLGVEAFRIQCMGRDNP